MPDCIFCKIISGDLPSEKVSEGSGYVAFRDINPIAPVHVLVVPKKHIPSLTATNKRDRKILGELQLAAAGVARKMGIEKAFRLLMANGKEAGQSVNHLHYHIIGGWKGGAPAMEAPSIKKGGE
jgi:histidine triad (HIT) family protein